MKAFIFTIKLFIKLNYKISQREWEPHPNINIKKQTAANHYFFTQFKLHCVPQTKMCRNPYSMPHLQRQTSRPNSSSKYVAGCGTGFIHSFMGSYKILSPTALVSNHYTEESGVAEKCKLVNLCSGDIWFKPCHGCWHWL